MIELTKAIVKNKVIKILNLSINDHVTKIGENEIGTEGLNCVARNILELGHVRVMLLGRKSTITQ